MYSFEPSEEQQMLIGVVKGYAKDALLPAARDAEEEGEMPMELVERGWGEIGILQASVPGEYGGFGERSVVTGTLAAEELAWGDLALSLGLMTPNLFVVPILLVGTEEQKKTHIPPVIEGDWQPYTSALMEPAFDFDPQDLLTTAEEDGDDYILNGEKVYVPFADQAKAMIVYASLNGQSQGFIVPAETKGMEVGERQKLLGINALPVYSVKYNKLRIPKDNRLGGPDGHDFAPLLDASRVALSAMAIGVSRAAYEYSMEYAKDRDVFGVKVAQKQAIAFMLAEMATEIEAIRMLAWEAAWMLDNNKEEASKQAYLAQFGAAEMAMMVTDRAVQILGGHGYIREHPVELWMRNGRGFSTFAGIALI